MRDYTRANNLAILLVEGVIADRRAEIGGAAVGGVVTNSAFKRLYTPERTSRIYRSWSKHDKARSVRLKTAPRSGAVRKKLFRGSLKSARVKALVAGTALGAVVANRLKSNS